MTLALASPALLALLLVLRPRGGRTETHPLGGGGPLPRLLLATLALTLLRLPALTDLPSGLLLLDGALQVTPGGKVMEGLLPLLTGALLLAAPRGATRPEHALLLASHLAGLSLLPWSQDLLLTLTALQLANLSIYLLLGSQSRSESHLATSLRYLLLSAFASALFLLGLLWLYALHGTVRLDGLTLLALGEGTRWPHLAALLLLATGLLLKLGAAPLHHWAPDVYGGTAPLPASFLLILPKAPLVLTLMSLLPLVAPAEGAAALLPFAMASVLLGTAGMGGQATVRRWLALSALAHVGYLLLTLATGESSATLLYLVTYLPASTLLLCLLLPLGAGPLATLVGLGWRRPALLMPVLLALLSLAGLPPLPGFAAKLALLAALVRADLLLAAGVVLLGSVVGAAFYLRVVRVTVMDLPLFPPQGTVTSPDPLTSAPAFALASLSLFLLAFALRPAPLLALATLSYLLARLVASSFRVRQVITVKM